MEKKHHVSSNDIHVLAEYFLAYFSSSPHPALLINQEGTTLNCNKVFLDLFSLGSDDIINKNLFNTFETKKLNPPFESIAAGFSKKIHNSIIKNTEKKTDGDQYYQWV